MHRRGPSRETFFQAGRPLPTAGASPPSVLPHLETQSVFAAGPVLPTGTDLPERVELAQHPSRTGYEVLEYQRCPPRPWRERRGRRRMNQAARQDEEGRGEARRDETRRSEERLENGKNGEANSRAHTHTYTRAHSPSPCFGPATINERRAKIVLCFHPPSHRSFLPALHLPPFVASLSRGMGSIGTIRRLSGFLRGGEDQHIGADSRKSWCEFDGEKNRQSLISIVKFLSFFF